MRGQGMKEGWEYKKLGEVCKRITDGSHNPPQGVEKSCNYMLSSQNVQNGYLDMSSVRYLSDENFRIENQRTQAKKGDVLLTIVGTIGRTWVLDGTEGNITFQRSVAILKPSEEINSRFLMYFLLSQNSKLNSTAQGAAQKGIYLKQLGNIEVQYPSFSEQQSIVDYLDSAFAKIDAMKANAEKALNEAKALFQASLKEMLEPKEGWEEKTLKEVCSLITDGTHHSPPNNECGKYKYITAKNIRIWGLDLSNITYVSEEVHKEIIARCNPQKGDVLYIKDGATTGIAIVNPLDEEFSMLSSVALIKPNKDVLLSEFLCYTLNSPSIYNQTRNQMDGAAITRVTLVKIKGFVISVPPLTEQQSIVATLDSLKSKVDRLQGNYDKISQECDALKQAILRQVFR